MYGHPAFPKGLSNLQHRHREFRSLRKIRLDLMVPGMVSIFTLAIAGRVILELIAVFQ